MPQVQAPPIDPMPQPKPMPQDQKILKMLRDAGSKGVPNYEFPKAYILRYSTRIHELRHDGHNIFCERQKVNGKSTGVFMYYLNEEADSAEA